MNSERINRVMVVEDDLEIREVLSTFLVDEGYRVFGAENGLMALQAIENGFLPGVILLDMRMPIMDGWEFARQFRNRYDGTAAIIVTTAAADARERANEIHAHDWIGKPYDLDEVLRKVKRVLDRSER